MSSVSNPLTSRPVVLVGLMGSGKSSIGRRLAIRLGMPFKDSDTEVEAAAGCSTEEIFERYGEAAFRDGERRVIRRLLSEPPCVLATGGGAFINDQTRSLIREKATSVWLRADLELLVQRTSRRQNRPLLKNGDLREILQKLIDVRYPVYAEADIVLDTDDSPQELTVDRLLVSLRNHLTDAAG